MASVPMDGVEQDGRAVRRPRVREQSDADKALLVEHRQVPLPTHPWVRLPSGRVVRARYVVRDASKVCCGVNLASLSNALRPDALIQDYIDGGRRINASIAMWGLGMSGG